MDLFLRVIRCTGVKNLDAGLRLLRDERAPAWHRMTGYRLSLIHEAPESGEVSVINFWDTEEDERASYQAIMPIGDQVTEVWTPAHSHTETYHRVVMPAATTRLEAGAWVRMIELEGIASQTIEAIISSYDRRVVPELLDHPGLQASFLALDRRLGKAVAASYWRDESSLRGSESTVPRLRREVAEVYGLRVENVTVAMLRLSDEPSAAGPATAEDPGRSEHEALSPGDTRVELEQLGDESIVVVRIKGTLDRFSGPRIKNILVRAMEAGTNELVIDPSGVVSVDSSGVGVLVGTLKRARRDGGGLRLAGENHKLSTMLRMMSLDQMFPHDGTVQDAITYFRTAPP